MQVPYIIQIFLVIFKKKETDGVNFGNSFKILLLF
jgi:hypothetical protein